MMCAIMKFGWQQQKKNTEIFDDVFPGKPQDTMTEEDDFKPWQNPRNVEKLEHVKGQVILFPLEFFFRKCSSLKCFQ